MQKAPGGGDLPGEKGYSIRTACEGDPQNKKSPLTNIVSGL